MTYIGDVGEIKWGWGWFKGLQLLESIFSKYEILWSGDGEGEGTADLEVAAMAPFRALQ